MKKQIGIINQKVDRYKCQMKQSNWLYIIF